MSFIVAIDGTAGSGKGTMANILAKELNLVNIDTGATYRCLALATLRANISLAEKEKIIELADNITIEIAGTNEEPVFLLNGEDVSKEIRSAEVTAIVSQISMITEVRIKLVELQRKMAENKNVVMDGRDIGTYVFPNANVKIYLDAGVETRAQRRFEENKLKGISMSYEDVLANIEMRDRQDKNKEIGSLKVADGATVIDTTNLTIQEVASKIKEIVKSKIK